MAIKVSSGKERTIIPDIGDNLKRPEAEQFQIILKKPSKWRIQDRTVRPVITQGEVEVEVNQRAGIELYIHQLVNPPDIEIDKGKTREMKTFDLFEYDELYPILEQIQKEIGEMTKEDEDSKN